jgi:hypothetical protein
MENFQHASFKLSNLRFLDVGGNEGITGYLPGFTWSSPVETLILLGTNFSVELPTSMGNLGFLTQLSLTSYSFLGRPFHLHLVTSLNSLRFSFQIMLSQVTFLLHLETLLNSLLLSFQITLSWVTFRIHLETSVNSLLLAFQIREMLECNKLPTFDS